MFGLTLFVLLLLTALNLSQARRIIIDTMHGKIQGFEMSTVNGAKANVFLGVPYASPPVFELRFRPPQSIQPWPHILNATKLRPMCVQTFYENESEDCLYMNIYVPTRLTRKKLHPVLLWIHGGSFILGSGNYFHVDGTIDNLVNRGMIFVSINYRLGLYGFSSMLNKDLPGNLGLRDQISALEWIRANIRSFNGDPDSVTVAGDSAGAVSVSILAISPLAKGLFHRMILKSGSALMHCALRTHGTKRRTEKVFNTMNCRDVDCLKNSNKTALNDIYVDLLMEAVQDPYERLQGMIIFSPVIDDYMGEESVLPKHPSLLMKENAHLPALISTTSDERLGLFGALASLSEMI